MTTTEMTAKKFTTASNARRAARQAGLAEGSFRAAKVAEGFYMVELVSDATPAEAPTETTGTTAPAEGFIAGPVTIQAGDFEAVVPDTNRGELQELADATGTDAIARHHITDEVLVTVEPKGEKAAEAPAAPQAPAANENAAEGTPAAADEAETYEIALTATPALMAEIARMMAKMGGAPVFYRLPGGPLVTVEPKARAPKAEKPAREPKAPKAPAEPKAKKDAPEGKRAIVLEMCLRETGASPKELFEATKWHGAPWKWLLSNPQGTGLADRYGYDLTANRDADGARYFLTPKEGAKAAA